MKQQCMFMDFLIGLPFYLLKMGKIVCMSTIV